jgi:microcystin-dependent protein
MTKISALPSDTAPLTTDVLPMVDVANSTTKKVLVSDLVTLLTTYIYPTGIINPHGGRIAPTGFLLCDGAAVSRTTYSALFNIISASIGTFTVTIASPGVVTLNGHNLQTGDQVYLTTTGALPTGLVANTLYYVVRIDANTFNLATSRANAYAGTKINTSGTQSGTHTSFDCPFGLGDGSTTFNIPDLRGRAVHGNDSMNGTVASRLTLQSLNGVYGNKGASGGEQSHQITQAEMASHIHTEQVATGGGAGTGITGTANLVGNTGSNQSTTSIGSDNAHNNMQPALVTNYVIKT